MLSDTANTSLQPALGLPSMLTPSELQRYQRHLMLPGFGQEAQLRLKRARVLMVGAGGLGCPALLYLAAAGVGQLTILDPDRVEKSNLQRQVLYTEQDLGQAKAEAAARRLRALNPDISVKALVTRFSRDNALSLLADHDLLVDGSDNFRTRYLVNDACVLAQKPFIYGAIHRFEGQVSVFNFRGGPTYRCLFPEEPPADSIPNCSEAGVLGVLPGLIGTAQACEAIKVLSGVGEPLSGRLLIWDALSMQTRLLRLSASATAQAIRELPPEAPALSCSTTMSNSSLEITVDELKVLLASSTPPQLIDVREVDERPFGTISPDTNLPLSALASLPCPDSLDPKRDTIVYCAGGVRSLRALPVLQQRLGFTQLRSLKGGFKAWSAA